MDKERFNHLKSIMNQKWSDSASIPQMYFNLSDLKWLLEQVSYVEYYEMKIKELHEVERALESNEIDGFDHSEKMSEIVDSIFIRNL